MDAPAPTPAQPAEAAPKLVVHHLNNSRSQRILWLLEELEVPYEIKKYQRTSEMLAPPELKTVNPLGGAPVITDDGFNLSESGAIIEYIIQKYGNGKAQPPASGKIDDLYFTHYSEASLMPMLVNKLIFHMIPERSPFFLRPLLKSVFSTVSAKMLDPRLKIHAEMIEAHLAKNDRLFFAGGEEPTAADFMMIFALEVWSGRNDVRGPKTKAYVERIHARPAYQRGLEKGGEYAYAKLA
ncbi:thioredoxin-like protein [Lenzites betulinus]|nr:thioredoxin-like protein [Lenzites betulinus]